MVSKLCVMDFPDTEDALGPQIITTHILELTSQQLLRLPLEVVTLERLTKKWNQNAWDSCVARRGRCLLNTYYVVGILRDMLFIHIHSFK